MKWRPRGDLERLLPESISIDLFPVCVNIPKNANHRIPMSEWPKIIKRYKTESLRQLAKEYGVSHETIRRVFHQPNEEATTAGSIRGQKM